MSHVGGYTGRTMGSSASIDSNGVNIEEVQCRVDVQSRGGMETLVLLPS